MEGTTLVRINIFLEEAVTMTFGVPEKETDMLIYDDMVALYTALQVRAEKLSLSLLNTRKQK